MFQQYIKTLIYKLYNNLIKNFKHLYHNFWHCLRKCHHGKRKVMYEMSRSWSLIVNMAPVHLSLFDLTGFQ